MKETDEITLKAFLIALEQLVVLKNPKERDEFKERYRDWLSSHPQGL